LEKELHRLKKLPKSIIPGLPETDRSAKSRGNSNELMLNSLTSYLQYLITEPFIREHSKALYEFLEISLLPLSDGPKKYKEGYLKKRTGGRYKENICQVYCGIICRRWLKRWFVINNEGILYTIDSNSTRVREMLLFDQSFKIEYGRKATGTHTGIILKTPTRKLNLQAKDLFQTIDWMLAINEAVRDCPYIKINRFNSFAPLRPPTALCRWYVDGEHYFEDIYNSLIEAKKEVFIADWWLSPEFYLKRPVINNDITYRLDTVLGQIANKGVRVYILVYREVKIALANDSEYTKQKLQSLSPNIKVLRHPKEFLFLWSHHEKLVVIDQKIGFLGGLDLCYGRMDMSSHPLHDPAFQSGQGETFPGIDFVNLRLSDFRNVRDFNTCTIDKISQPRMPWHDIAMKVVGEPVRDLARHFIQFWNFAKIDLQPKKQDYFLTPKDMKLEEKYKDQDGSPKLTKKKGIAAKLSQILLKNSIKLEKNELYNDNFYHILPNEDFCHQERTRFDDYIESKMSMLNDFDGDDLKNFQKKTIMINSVDNLDFGKIEEKSREKEDSRYVSPNLDTEEEKSERKVQGNQNQLLKSGINSDELPLHTHSSLHIDTKIIDNNDTRRHTDLKCKKKKKFFFFIC